MLSSETQELNMKEIVIFQDPRRTCPPGLLLIVFLLGMEGMEGMEAGHLTREMGGLSCLSHQVSPYF